MINSQPLFQNGAVSFVFEAKEIEVCNLKNNTCGNILVRLRSRNDLPFASAKLKDLRYGDELILSGNLFRPFREKDSSRQSYRDYLYNQSIFAVMNVRMPCSIVRLRQNSGFILKRLAFCLKDKIESIVFKRVSYVPAGIIDAMILGEKKNIPALVNSAMMKSGTVHILVVSGFNVALVASIIILFLKLVRIPRGMRFYISTPLIIIYCLMTGASTPVVRATIMAIVFMFAHLVKREADIYNSLALAAILILGIYPRQLFDIGFQLSFVSVISIVYVYPKLKLLLSPKLFKIRFVGLLCEGFLVSLSAWVGTVFLIAYNFRLISFIAVLANIFIVPLASLITLCGFSLLLAELICPYFAPLFAHSSEFMVSILLNINALLIKFPFAYFNLS
jgi:competence protein ComEC